MEQISAEIIKESKIKLICAIYHMKAKHTPFFTTQHTIVTK